MDPAENESQANFFDSTINETVTDSILPSIDPNHQDLISKNQSGLFSTTNGTLNQHHNLPLNHSLIQQSARDPSLPMIPEPFGDTWDENADEEEKVPPPPEDFSLDNSVPPFSRNQPGKNIEKLLEDNRTISLNSEDHRSGYNLPNPPQEATGNFDENDQIQLNNTKKIDVVDGSFGKVQKYHVVRFSAVIKLESLGKGAFGEVFRVFDKDERNFYALKEIKRQNFAKTAQFQNTIWTEMRNLLKVHDSHDSSLLNIFGINVESENGVCSFLMELGSGTLHEYNQFRLQNSIAWREEELLSILCQLVGQLDKLNNLGIFHRDVKPENIIITNNQNKLKLSDLGCAWLAEEGTESFNIAGTPYFMAPELAQALMSKQKRVEYSPYLGDLFSIGVTILRLVNSSLKRSELLSFLNGKFNEDYPGLHRYLKGLLAAEPAIREETAKEILSLESKNLNFTKKEENDYKSFLFRKVVDRSGDSLDPSLYFEMFIFDEAEMIIQNQIAKEKKKNGDEKSFREIEWSIALAECYIFQRKFEPAFKELDELSQLPQIEQSGSNTEGQILKAKVLFWTGYALAGTGKFEEAVKRLNECLEIREKIWGENHEDVAIVHLRFGYTYFNQGKYDEAHKAFEKCISINTACKNENTLNVAKSYNNIGVILETQRKYEEALKNFKKALQIYLNLYGEDYPYVADQYNNIGNIFFGQEKFSEANDYYYKALKIKKKYHGENSPEVALVNGNIASTMDRMFKFNEAISYMKKSYEIYKTKYGENHPELAHIVFLIGNTLLRQSKYQESLDNHLTALEMLKNYYGNDSPHLTENYISCGKVSEQLANYDESYKYYTRALELHLNAVGENIKTAQIYKRLALLLFDAQKTEEAMSFAEKALETCRKVSHKGGEDQQCAECLEILARKARKEKRYEESLEDLEKMLALKLAKFGESHHECGISFIMVGRAKQKVKQYEQALAAYRKANVILSRVIPDDHYGMGDIYYRIGSLFKEQKKYTEASRDLGRALEIFTKCFDKKHPRVKKCQQRIAELNQSYLVQESGY